MAEICLSGHQGTYKLFLLTKCTLIKSKTSGLRINILINEINNLRLCNKIFF